MKKLDKRLFRMIKNTKGQYIAVLSIIITGIFVFTAVSNSAKNLKDAVDDYYVETNFADIAVKGSGIPEKTESRLAGTGDIKDAEGRIVFDTSFITDNEDEDVDVRVVSVDKNENKINKLFMKSGKRTLTENDIILIEQFAAARNISVGDKVKIKINGRQYDFKVSGIASSSEYVYMMENEQMLLPDPENFGVVYLEEDYLRRIYSRRGDFNEILIKVNNDENIDKTADYLEDTLDGYGVSRIIKKQDQLSNSMLSQEISGLEMMSKSVPVVFLVFAGIMLATMLSRIVKKDRTSIGVLKAMGFTNGEVVVHYLKYAASVGIIGGFLGSVVGTALSGAMTNYYLVFFNIPSLTVKVYYYRILISVVLSLLFCIISGFLGVRGIIRINPAESMKPEAPKKGKRIFIENIKFIWDHVPFSWKVVVRNIFREKRKFVFIGAAVAITCGMMIMTTWMIDIVDIMFNRHYGEFVKVQYNVSFDGFKDRSVLNEFTEAADIKEMEGRIEMPFEIENGRASKIVNVIGLEEKTVFYGFKDMNGNRIQVPSDGILISSNLADSLNVGVGDEVLLKSFVSDDKAYASVKGIVNQSLGINGYMDIDYLRKKFLNKGIINGVYINSDEDIPNKLDDMKNITIQSQSDMKKAFEEFTAVTAMSMGFMVIFSGLLGFVIVYSMTLMSINERTLEFSSLRVMGFSKKEIFNMLVRENMIMTVIGVIAGIPVGLRLVDYLGSSFTTDVYTMNEPVSSYGIFVSIVMTIVFIMLAQMMTYAKIHKLDFMQALKNRIS
ncbi:MAG TPA: peptide ABC transporter permease [Clostridiales bacterium]|nr:peptide ABC transporter permease [Clostridiales bacterium]